MKLKKNHSNFVAKLFLSLSHQNYPKNYEKTKQDKDNNNVKKKEEEAYSLEF